MYACLRVCHMSLSSLLPAVHVSVSLADLCVFQLVIPVQKSATHRRCCIIHMIYIERQPESGELVPAVAKSREILVYYMYNIRSTMHTTTPTTSIMTPKIVLFVRFIVFRPFPSCARTPTQVFFLCDNTQQPSLSLPLLLVCFRVA